MRTPFLASLLLVSLLPAQATSTPTPPVESKSASKGEVPRIQSHTDRPEAWYLPGETVIFHFKPAADSLKGSVADWQLSKDGLPPFLEGKAQLNEEGTFKIEGKLDEPGFLSCKIVATAPSGLKVSALCAAAISPEVIQPSMPAPEDFDLFWDTKKKQLANIQPTPRLNKAPSPQPDIELFDVQIKCVGPDVSGYFARPTSKDPALKPAILTLHGAGVRSASTAGPIAWAKEGFLAMDINAHGIPNGRPPEHYDGQANSLSATSLKDYRFRGITSRESHYFVGMFLRIIRAIDFLTSQKDWDGQTMIVFGSSQGGAQALAAAGLDSRVTFFAAGVPAMCDHTGFAANRINGWPKFLKADPMGDDDQKIAEASRYVDCVNFASRIKAPGIVTVGFVDTVCPPTGIFAAYNAIPSQKAIYTQPGIGHSSTPEATHWMKTRALQAAFSSEK
jgi:cephalosporin-C deacetylase-like acetyl esterase